MFIKVMHRQQPKHPQSGFTLLEMLLVLFLMGLMASAALMLTDEVESQAKYDLTKQRMEIMRKAIVGDPTRTVNGSPEISGFVADMGRLPACLAELLAQRDCDDLVDLADWAQDGSTEVFQGWRGPYIQVVPEEDGSLHFRDGYGNKDGGEADDRKNSGWEFTVSDADDTITLASAGLNDDMEITLVAPSDYEVSFQNWGSVPVMFRNTGGADITIAANELKLSLNAPEEDTQSGTFPSSAILLVPASNRVAVSNAENITVPAGSSLTDTTLAITVSGAVKLVPILAGDQLTVPTGSTLSGTTLVAGAAGHIEFPGASVVVSGLAVDTLPAGGYSVTIVCDSNGERYDGDCDTSYENQPYLLAGPPQGMPIAAPNPLIWEIQ